MLLFAAASLAFPSVHAQESIDFANIKDYTIEADFNTLVAKSTLLWGADKDKKNFKRWEIYEGQNLRMFSIKDGALGNEGANNNIGISGGAKIGEYHHLKIEVTGGNHVKTYVNDGLVDERDGDYPFGYLGFFADGKDNGDWVNAGALWLDDLKVTDGEGNILLDEDFSDGSCFSVGSPVGGCYYSYRTGSWTVLQTSESFKASDTKDYTFEAKLSVERGTPDLVFGSDESGNSFHMYRLNPDGNNIQYFSKTAGSFSNSTTITLDPSVFSDRYRLHDFKIVVSQEGTKLETYIDGNMVDRREGSFSYGRVGYNSDIPAGSSKVARPQRAYFDNVKVTAVVPAESENEVMLLDDESNTWVALSEDFENPEDVKFAGVGANIYGGNLLISGHTSWGNPSYIWQNKEFVANESGIPTGVSEINASQEQTDDTIYDLMGRKVTNPSNGIYIKKGKKIVIR